MMLFDLTGLTPSPSPVEVFVHTGPAEWWQIVAALGPLAVLLGAFAAVFIGLHTVKQKTVADNRAEWWKRTQWALDAVYSDDAKRGTVGLKVLKVLGESELAGSGELAVLEAAWEQPLEKAKKRLPKPPAPPGAGSELLKSFATVVAPVMGVDVISSVLFPSSKVDEPPKPGDNGGEEETPVDVEGGKR